MFSVVRADSDLTTCYDDEKINLAFSLESETTTATAGTTTAAASTAGDSAERWADGTVLFSMTNLANISKPDLPLLPRGYPDFYTAYLYAQRW